MARPTNRIAWHPWLWRKSIKWRLNESSVVHNGNSITAAYHEIFISIEYPEQDETELMEYDGG